MSDERLQILKMVQEGKVSPEEAAKLLEAVEQPAAKAPAGKPKHIRIEAVEGGKSKSFSIGVGLATWALRMIPGMITFTTSDGRDGEIDRDAVLAAIESGKTGKILEFQDGKNRLEIWLDT